MFLLDSTLCFFNIFTTVHTYMNYIITQSLKSIFIKYYIIECYKRLEAKDFILKSLK